MAGTSRSEMVTQWGAELTGVIQSQWGEDVNVTLDDKLHKSLASVQTCAGPVNWSTSGTHTYAGPIDFNSTLTVAQTATFSSLMNIGGGVNVTNTATFNNHVDMNSTLTVAGIITCSTTIYFANGTVYYVNQAGTAKFNSCTFVSTVTFGGAIDANSTVNIQGVATFQTHVYFGNGTTWYVDNSGNAKFGSTVTASIITNPTGAYVDFGSGLELKISDVGCSNVKALDLGEYPEISLSSSGGLIIRSGATAGDLDMYITSDGTGTDAPQVRSAVYEKGQVGNSAVPWFSMHAKEMYDDDGTLGSYDVHDDLRIIREIRPWIKDGETQRNADGIPLVDYNTIPEFLKGYKHKTEKIKVMRRVKRNGKKVDEEVEMLKELPEVEKRKYVRPSNLAMFAIGAIKQLDIREEEHFNQILDAIETLRTEVQSMKG